MTNENLEPLPSISFPDQKNYEAAYGLALKLASEKLANLTYLEEQCRRSGSICQTTGSNHTITLKYLNRSYQVVLPGVTISPVDSAENVELRDRILILHYLTQAKGTPLSGKLISYHDLKEATVYFPSFSKRAIKPLIDYFGQFPEKLLPVSKEMGGYPASLGDAAVTIPAFSCVPITLVIWKGDTEFPPEANILFDSTIQDYLPTEDIIVLCQTIVWRMVRGVG